MKKIIFCLIALVFAFPYSAGIAKAEEQKDIQNELEQTTSEQISNIDLLEIENSLKDADLSIFEGINGNSAVELIENIVDGKTDLSFGSIFFWCNKICCKSL